MRARRPRGRKTLTDGRHKKVPLYLIRDFVDPRCLGTSSVKVAEKVMPKVNAAIGADSAG